jgi:hypothetical protein
MNSPIFKDGFGIGGSLLRKEDDRHRHGRGQPAAIANAVRDVLALPRIEGNGTALTSERIRAVLLRVASTPRSHEERR